MEDILLQVAATNHAEYLNSNNDNGHTEIAGNHQFTGTKPDDRANFVGYQTGIAENVSTHSEGSYKESIEGLLSAIYHRFAFLTPTHDVIGIGDSSTVHNNVHAYVYNIANSQINALCKGTSFNGAGSYWLPCSDTDFRIADSRFQAANFNIANSNPNIIKWPAEGMTDVTPAFYEETPDPLPSYGVSGYPVSIEFNKYTTPPTVTEFTLTKVADNTLEPAIIVMNESNDPHHKFTAYQHTLFPMNRLDWASEYKVDVFYNDGLDKQLSWNFITRSFNLPMYEMGLGDRELTGVISGKPFIIYLPPQNSFDATSAYSSSFDSRVKLDINILDGNTLHVTATGTGQVKITFHRSVFTFTL
jgi:hypothetical protein